MKLLSAFVLGHREHTFKTTKDSCCRCARSAGVHSTGCPAQVPDLATITLNKSKHSRSLSPGVVHLVLPPLNVASQRLHVVHLATDGIVTALQVLQPALLS